eukprot:COSAG03_NODE_27315_length_254_cov_0.496774_1_plen_56_part_01
MVGVVGERDGGVGGWVWGGGVCGWGVGGGVVCVGGGGCPWGVQARVTRFAFSPTPA